MSGVPGAADEGEEQLPHGRAGVQHTFRVPLYADAEYGRNIFQSLGDAVGRPAGDRKAGADSS